MRRRWLRVTLMVTAALLGFGGYYGWDYLVLWPVARPADPISGPIGEDELSAHVRFLASPSLKGRLPMSMGSRIARHYIADRFRACGLKPWGNAKDFQQPFSIGTNVVGVLPGRDPALANEYILLTAHHDHLGNGRLGACDDASGVAALLEIAENLAARTNKLRRPVAFAVFDCEETGLIGAYAFGLRDDVKRAKIRAALNVDMLGRHFLDLLDNGLIVAGSEYYPKTREALWTEGEAQGIGVYAAGMDLAGMRGDHVAFMAPANGASEPPLVLFFSCGSFDGYHEKGDTADRLDYGLLARSTRLIGQTAARLANAESFEPRADLTTPDRRELALFEAVGTEMLRRGPGIGLNETDRKACEWWLGRARGYAFGPSYTHENRLDLLQYLPTLGPPVRKLLAEALGGGRDARPSSAEVLESVGSAEIWTRYAAAFDAGYRGFVQRILQYDALTLAVRGLPEPYDYEVPCLSARDVTLADAGNGSLRLAFLEPTVRVYGEVRRFGQSGVWLSVWGAPREWVGTRDELVDRCLLSWLMARPTDAYAQWLANHPPGGVTLEQALERLKRRRDPQRLAGLDAGNRLLLETVTGERHGATIDDWLGWRLRQTGSPDRDTWVYALLGSGNPEVVFAACHAFHFLQPEQCTDLPDAACRRILDDRQAYPIDRASAMHFLAVDGGVGELRHLADYLHDETIVEPVPDFAEDTTDPLRGHPLLRYGKLAYAQEKGLKGPPEPVALGDVALYELQVSTGKDLGKDAAAWRRLSDEGFVPGMDTGGWHRRHPALRRPGYYVWQSEQ